MENEALSITDKRTDAKYELALSKGAVRAADLRQIKTSPEDFGVMSYDPAFLNTASCKSAITFIDGDKGILRYRGYPIEQLAEKCSFLEVAYLILFGELPTAPELKDWTDKITYHTMLHESTKKFLEGFHHDAHPMGMFISTVAALSTIYPDARNVLDPDVRKLQIYRLIGKVPTIAAYCYRHSLGFPYVYPDNALSYAENFMNMLWKMTELKYEPNSALARARRFVYPACRSRAELQCQCHAFCGQLAGGPIRCHRRRCSRAFRPIAWRCKRRSVEDAGRDRIQRPHPCLH